MAEYAKKNKMFIIGLICLALAPFIVWGDAILNGRSSQVVQLSIIEQMLDNRIAESNVHFEAVKGMYANMWPQSNARFMAMEDCLTSMCLSQERIAEALEELAGI